MEPTTKREIERMKEWRLYKQYMHHKAVKATIIIVALIGICIAMVIYILNQYAEMEQLQEQYNETDQARQSAEIRMQEVETHLEIIQNEGVYEE